MYRSMCSGPLIHSSLGIDINDIPVLSTTAPVVESACDLRLVIASRLTLSAHVAVLLCWAEYYQLQQLRPLIQSMTVKAAKTVAAAFISCRLALQFAGHSAAQVAVHAERHCMTDPDGHTTSSSHHTGTTGTPLATSSRPCQVQNGMFDPPVTVWEVTWLMTAASFPTAPGALCGQRFSHLQYRKTMKH